MAEVIKVTFLPDLSQNQRGMQLYFCSNSLVKKLSEMKDIKKIMVGLDFTDTDTTLIKYTAFLCESIKPDRIYFIHVEKDLEIPREAQQLLPDMGSSVDEKYKKAIEDKLSEEFKYIDWIDHVVGIVEGQPFSKLLHWAKIKDVDLLVVGRKNPEYGSGIVAHKLARKAPCNVLLVPENPPKSLTKILMPVDMSEHSKLAAQMALRLSYPSPDCSIQPFCVFVRPDADMLQSLNDEEREDFIKSAVLHVNESYDEWVMSFDAADADQLKNFNIVEGNHIARTICRFTSEKEGSLIVMGSKGANAVEALLLGSNTEKVIMQNLTIPLLVVKKKGENQQLLKALGAV